MQMPRKTARAKSCPAPCPKNFLQLWCLTSVDPENTSTARYPPAKSGIHRKNDAKTGFAPSATAALPTGAAKSNPMLAQALATPDKMHHHNPLKYIVLGSC